LHPVTHAMITRLVGVTTLVLLAGCAGTSLPYTPAQQPAGARVSAAYQVVVDRLRIELDTDGRRVEEAKILKADGSELRALAIDMAPPTVSTGSPLSIGIGGGTFGSRGGVGVGTGVSVGMPVGGGETVGGHTFAWFALDQAGSAPWRVYVKLAGVEPTVIEVGGALPNK
jgi:hypothetical protein